MLKRWLVVLVCLLIFPAEARVLKGSAPSQTVFTHDQIGGAGALIGVASVPAAGVLLYRTDQYGCGYSLNNSQWVQLLTVARMPALSVINADNAPIQNSNGNGCDELVGDNATPPNLWLGFNGGVYLSTNSGGNFSPTCYPAQTPANSAAQNQALKNLGHTIAADPQQPLVAYMSTGGNGLIFTKDQGANCSTVAAVGVGTTVPGSCNATCNGGHAIAFDISAGTIVVGGQTRTKSIYVATYGVGVFHSNDGGQTWSPVSGAPTTYVYMAADAVGVLWFVENSSGSGGGTPWKYNGAWVNLASTIGGFATAVAYDPAHCTLTTNCHVYFQLGGGGGSGSAYSQDDGSTWHVATSITITSSDVPWVAPAVTAIGFFPAGAAFDGAGRACTGDEGFFCTTPPTSGTAVTYASQTAGIEEFLNSQIATSPNTPGAIVATGWDVACMRLVAAYSSFPISSQQGCATPNTGSLQHGYAVDWDGLNPSNFVSLVDNQQGYSGGAYASYSGSSSDGGVTWAKFASIPAAISSGGYEGGCMAVNNGHIMWAPTDGVGGNVAPFYWSGTTWAQLSIAGVTGGWPWRYYLNSHQCAADRVTADTFYFYNWNTGSGGDAIIKCVATTCSIQGRPGFNNSLSPNIKAVPGQAGYIFVSGGSIVPPTSTSGGLMYSTNGGGSLNSVASATGVTAFGFGKAAAGHSFPTIQFNGWYSGVYGIWESTDWDTAQTWHQVGTYPRSVPLAINDIEGDKGTTGVFHYGTTSGISCSTLSTSQCNGGT